MKLTLLLLLLAALAHGSDVTWSRFKGKVKAINGRASTVTIQNGEGDLIMVKVDGDVRLIRDKGDVALADLSIDEKVTLVFEPKAPAAKESEDPIDGGVYAPIKR